MFDSNLFDVVGVVSSVVIFMLGVILVYIPVPRTEGWDDFRQMRIYLVAAYLILALVGVVNNVVEIPSQSSGGVPSGNLSYLERLIVLFIASFQALLFTATNLTFIRSRFVRFRNMAGNSVAIFVVALICFPLLKTEYHQIMIYVAGALYGIQLIAYTAIFQREFELAVKRLEEHYDDNMKVRIEWIRLCYYSALVVGVAAFLLSVLPVSKQYYTYFTILYTIYYLYILSRVIYYRINAKFIIEAPISIEPEEVKQPLVEPMKDYSFDMSKYDELEQRLEEWVELRKYIASDVATNDIVAEIGVSRRLFSSYFTQKHNTTFRKWRQDLRLEEATKILENPEYIKVSAIYQMVGFSDDGNFYREFHKKYGTSPAKYRKRFVE